MSVYFKQWSNEQAVKGTYHKVPFTGKLVERVNKDGTVNPTYCRQSPGGAFIFVIRFDTPITLFGRECQTGEIWDNDDASELHLA